MNLNSNSAKSIAALLVLNAGLFVSHHASLAQVHQARAVRAQVFATRSQVCAASLQARVAAAQARVEARVAQHAMENARRQMQQGAQHAAIMAPSCSSTRSRTSLTDYVRSLVSFGSRSVNGGI